MANTKTITDIIEFVGNPDNLMSFGKSFATLNGQPLDKNSVFDSKTAADTFAASASAYVGQKIIVVENNTVKLYVIQIDGTLKEISYKIIIDNQLSDTSENPVQNKIIKAALDDKQKKLTAGKGIAIDESTGTITATGEVVGEIPVATPTVVGGIKIGTDFDITTDGILSLDSSAAIDVISNDDIDRELKF